MISSIIPLSASLCKITCIWMMMLPMTMGRSLSMIQFSVLHQFTIGVQNIASEGLNLHCSSNSATPPSKEMGLAAKSTRVSTTSNLKLPEALDYCNSCNSMLRIAPDIQTLMKRQPKVRARVSRTWRSSASWTGFHCILIDEDETRMEAVASQQDADFFSAILQEGEIYELSGFQVKLNRKNFRPLPHEFMIQLIRATSVANVSTQNIFIPMHKFIFTDFDMLDSLIHKDENLTEIIGQVVSVGSITGGTEHQRKSLVIRNLSKKELAVTLWEKHALDFNEKAILHQTNPIVIIFTGMTVRSWKERTCVCSSYATRHYINLDVPEVADFLARIPDSITVTELAPIPTLSIASTVNSLDPAVATVTDLLDIDPSKLQNTRFICKATLINIDASEGWWYRACPKCKTAVQAYRATIWCNRCYETDVTPIPCYKLNLIVEDHTGKTNFIMFGKTVTDLIHIPVANLTATSTSNRHSLPPVFMKLLGKDYLFIVTPSNRSFQQNAKSFKVVTVSVVAPTAATPPETQPDIAIDNMKGDVPGKPTSAQRQLFLESSSSKNKTFEETESASSPSIDVNATNVLITIPKQPAQTDLQEPQQKRRRNIILGKEKKD